MNSWQQPVSGEPSIGYLHPISPFLWLNNVTRVAATNYTYDISAYIPSGVTFVVIQIQGQADGGNANIIFYADSGRTDERNWFPASDGNINSAELTIPVVSGTIYYRNDGAADMDNTYARLIGYYT